MLCRCRVWSPYSDSLPVAVNTGISLLQVKDWFTGDNRLPQSVHFQTQTHSEKTLGVCVGWKLSQTVRANFSAAIYFDLLCINKSDILQSRFSIYANSWRHFHLDLSSFSLNFLNKLNHEKALAITNSLASSSLNRFRFLFFYPGHEVQVSIISKKYLDMAPYSNSTLKGSCLISILTLTNGINDTKILDACLWLKWLIPELLYILDANLEWEPYSRLINTQFFF